MENLTQGATPSGDLKNETEKKPEEKASKKPGHWKNKLIFILFLIIIIGSTGAWFYWQKSGEKIRQSEIMIETMEILETEKTECSRVLNQESGDFKEYEYCKRLIKVFE